VHDDKINQALEGAMSDIRFEQVSRRFGDFAALGNIDLNIRDREFVAIVGTSGCGKTTLLRMVAGLEVPSEGRVSVGGQIVARPGLDRAVVFQQFALFPWKTVAENIAFGLRSKGSSRADLKRAVQSYIDLMHLQGYENAFPHQLSGGMHQRVAIARAYAVEPDVLLMDEPFGALDAQTRTVMQEELLRICLAKPRTVLFITHSVEEAVYLAQRVVVMSGRPGRIREEVEIATTRLAEHWNSMPRIEDVLELPSFTHLRTHIWKLLRE
jgi:NitT/TauT family transport system ATP-binding protein